MTMVTEHMWQVLLPWKNNNVGGVGIAYKSKIMPIKAGGSDGTFNSTDIARE